MGGLLAGIILNPIDVAKTRAQGCYWDLCLKIRTPGGMSATRKLQWTGNGATGAWGLIKKSQSQKAASYASKIGFQKCLARCEDKFKWKPIQISNEVIFQWCFSTWNVKWDFIWPCSTCLRFSSISLWCPFEQKSTAQFWTRLQPITIRHCGYVVLRYLFSFFADARHRHSSDAMLFLSHRPALNWKKNPDLAMSLSGIVFLIQKRW